jgi:acyl-coenzyme A synthetase/AMP-(fatty) acid ligase
MINKNILTDNFSYEDEKGNVVSREEMCSLIDRWKFLLVKRGAMRGDSLGISLVMVSPNHLALIFAAGELAMRLVLLDKPAAVETIDRTKASVFNPIDFHVVDEYLAKSEPYMEMVNRYCKMNIFETEIDSVTEKMLEDYSSPDEIFLCGSSSGTTSRPKPVYFTQKDCFDLSKRNTGVFKFEPQSVVCHTRNMHHVSCMMTFLLPALMVADKHYYYNIYDDMPNFFTFIKEKKVDRVFFGSAFVVRDLVKYFSDQFDATLLINLSGYTIPAEYVEYCEFFNVEFLSHFGSVDTGIPLLLNHVTKHSKWQENWLGVEPDDYYKIITGDEILVEGPWVGRRVLEDKLTEKNGKWYHNGRVEVDPVEKACKRLLKKDLSVYGNNLIIWNDSEGVEVPGMTVHYLSKEQWTTETKVNVYQLLGYLEKFST